MPINAVILCKRALDWVIADDMIRHRVPQVEARVRVSAYIVCVYSSSQEEEAKASVDKHAASVRRDLMRSTANGSRR